MMNDNQLARFLAKIEVDQSGCWIWTASARRDGYGQFNLPGRRGVTGNVKAAHRVAYQHFVGEVPDGLDLDHLCRLRRCVNPTHLEPVTRSENLRRGVGGRHVRTEAMRAAMSASLKARGVRPPEMTPERIARISASRRGQLLSDEHRAKLREAWVRRKARAA